MTFQFGLSCADLPEAPGLRVSPNQQRRRVPPHALRPGAGHRDCHRVAELRGEQDPPRQHPRRHQGLQGRLRSWSQGKQGGPGCKEGRGVRGSCGKVSGAIIKTYTEQKYKGKTLLSFLFWVLSHFCSHFLHTPKTHFSHVFSTNLSKSVRVSTAALLRSSIPPHRSGLSRCWVDGSNIAQVSLRPAAIKGHSDHSALPQTSQGLQEPAIGMPSAGMSTRAVARGLKVLARPAYSWTTAWPFMVASLRLTCSIFLPSAQRLDWPLL